MWSYFASKMKYSLSFLLYTSCEFLYNSYKFPVVMLSICQHSTKQLLSQAIIHVVHSISRMVYKCVTISRNSLKVLILVYLTTKIFFTADSIWGMFCFHSENISLFCLLKSVLWCEEYCYIGLAFTMRNFWRFNCD